MADYQTIVIVDADHWLVLEDWNNDDNSVTVIAPGGGSGGSSWTTNKATGGGGGGSRAIRFNVQLMVGRSIPLFAGIKGTGGDATTDGYPSTDGSEAWFLDPSFLKADGGKASANLSQSGAPGGRASNCIGDVAYDGGDGGDAGPDDFGGAGAGGSAALADAVGHDGGNGGEFSGGGGGGKGSDGGDGSGFPSVGEPGEDGGGQGGGYEDNEIVNAGSGRTSATDQVGGGAGGVSSYSTSDGADGGDFGGGAGGSSATDATFPFGALGGDGGRGAIIIRYRPLNIIKDVSERAKAGKPGTPVHIIEVDLAQTGIAGEETPITFDYTYGIGTRPNAVLTLSSGAAASVKTLRFSDLGFRAYLSDPDGPKVAPARSLSTFTLSRRLNLSLSSVSAGFAWGSVGLARVDGDFDVDGLFEGINYNSSDGVPARISMGWKSYDPTRKTLVEPDIDELELLFSGIAQPMLNDREQITIPFRDALYLLDVPLQRRLYGGSGGYDGNETIAGSPLPKLRGGTALKPVQNVLPVLIDPVNRIYQYNDAAGQIYALYEGGVSGGITFEADTDDLYSGSTTAAKYRTDNSRGLFQLGTDAQAEITVDATGSFSRAGLVTKVVDIASLLITEDMGISPMYLHNASFDDVSADYNYDAGVYFDPSIVWNGVDAVGFMLQGIGAKIAVDHRGRLRPFVVRSYTGDQYATYGAADIGSIRPDQIPDEFSPLAYRFRVRYGKNWHVQSSGLLASITPARQQFLSGLGSVATWADPLQKLRFQNAKDTTIIESALLNQADAQEVANRLGALWGTPRRAYAIELPLYGLQSELGACIKLDLDIGLKPTPAYGYQYGSDYTPNTRTCVIYVVI